MTRTRKLLTTAAPLALMLAMAAGNASAQSQPIPPEHYTLDPRGVDLVAGAFNYRATEVVIGQPGAGGLSYGRIYANDGWRDATVGGISYAGGPTVSIGPISEQFIWNGSSWESKYNNGSTYTPGTGVTTVTDNQGNVAVFDTTLTDVDHINAYNATDGLISTYSTPDGAVVTYHWKTQQGDCNDWSISGHCIGWNQNVRLQSVTNNRGYMIKYEYWSNTPTAAGWFSTKTVTGINLAIEWCDPDADSCTSLTSTWPSVSYDQVTNNRPLTATDQSGRVTTFGYTSGFLSSVQLPESSGPDVAVTYDASTPYNVTDVTDASGHWTYGFSTVGTTQTTSVSGPLSQALTVTTDLTIGRATSVTDALSNTWSYQYDGDLRLTRITQPESDYEQYSYDGRGNLTQTEWVPKVGSPLSSITLGASYPASCSSPGVTIETCNKPLTTTDGRGSVTDYEWDTTTGQIVSVTAPAPTPGADRPQTRYAYTPLTATYHDSASTYTSGPAVSMPTSVSMCATGEWDALASPPACDTGAAQEVLTSIDYTSPTTGDNLLPTSITRGSGATPNMATTSMTYTADGDVETVDGPLSGANDKVQYFHDDARQVTGVVGPDPDGGGALLHRAQRITYNDNGQVTAVETGTTSGYAEPVGQRLHPPAEVRNHL